MIKKKKIFLIFILFTLCQQVMSQSDTLDLLDSSDLDVLLEDKSIGTNIDLDISDLEEVDDLNSLKHDIGEVIFDKPDKKNKEVEKLDPNEKGKVLVDAKGTVINDGDTVNSQQDNKKITDTKTVIFEVGDEEKDLLDLSKFVEGKIPEKEWDSIATAAKVEKYVVQEGDWLWKISQTLFGTGFYYSKIWSLNPHITNPHEIEPGMTLAFTTGDADNMPQVKFGDFDNDPFKIRAQKEIDPSDLFDFREFGDDSKPKWIDERKKLIANGDFFQYGSDETYSDIVKLGQSTLENEYKSYDPPVANILVQEPGDEYDSSGFDKNSKIVFSFKEGFFLNTFVTSNIVQDLGEIIGMQKENVFIQEFDHIYVKFDDAVKVKPGDLFSIYVPGGKVEHKISDRAGYKYTIGAQIKVLRPKNSLWECIVTEQAGIIQRKDRITVYTPRINKIVKTFNKRNIEAAVIAGYEARDQGLAYGDVVYLDRGRADGVEMGTVFEAYSFYDRGTGKKLTPDPTYKIGELTVISLTDSFSTALVTNSSNPIVIGTIALTKTQEQAALARDLRNHELLKGVKDLEGKALDELDVELNLDDISKDLLDRADQVQLTEDELEELERQEREKSIIKDHERDLNELERLENEIMESEASLNEAKLDEDKFLEQQNLNDIETKVKGQNPNSFESLNDIEKEIGLKFMDEDLNSKENPYGLTEFDLEEIDELLNFDKL